jgi:hypothetical protein
MLTLPGLNTYFQDSTRTPVFIADTKSSGRHAAGQKTIFPYSNNASINTAIPNSHNISPATEEGKNNSIQNYSRRTAAVADDFREGRFYHINIHVSILETRHAAVLPTQHPSLKICLITSSSVTPSISLSGQELCVTKNRCLLPEYHPVLQITACINSYGFRHS